ncbi:MAG: DUF6142 family protein [Lachnospiraceae bacterium]|nr:DUF6142 family protein [Lachnospiraceae bacterium]
MSRKKGYIFTNKENALKGIMSSILGAIAIITLVIVLYLSYLESGQIPDRYAVAMLIAALLNIIGLVLGLVSYFEKEKFRFFPVLGLILNMISICIIGFIMETGKYQGGI